MAIPNLPTALRDKLKFDVTINHKELFATDGNLVHYPLIYLHGRTAVSFTPEDKDAIRRHLTGGGVLFADAACGSPAFDASFRQLAAELFPAGRLEALLNTGVDDAAELTIIPSIAGGASVFADGLAYIAGGGCF